MLSFCLLLKHLLKKQIPDMYYCRIFYLIIEIELSFQLGPRNEKILAFHCSTRFSFDLKKNINFK